jgi:hypothetical protein
MCPTSPDRFPLLSPCCSLSGVLFTSGEFISEMTAKLGPELPERNSTTLLNYFT